MSYKTPENALKSNQIYSVVFKKICIPDVHHTAYYHVLSNCNIRI